MSEFEKDYKDLLKRILENGSVQPNRTGVSTLLNFAEHLKIDITKGFPIVTGKKIFFDKAVGEFLWIVKGKTDVEYVKSFGVDWWDSYAVDGEIVKSYGYQLRNYMNTFDQLEYVFEEITKGSRRAHITLWNPIELKEQALPCCFTGLTFVVIGNTLNLSIDFRSSDTFLGLPYDIIFATLLLLHVSEVCELQGKYINLTLNDAHIYINHIAQVEEYLAKPIFDLPKLVKGRLDNYVCGSFIKAELNGK